MGFWDKSLRIFNSLCENATQSVRQLAQPTGLAKNSVHRLQQAMEPNARGEPRPMAGATQTRKLLGVGSSAFIGIQSCFQCYCTHLGGSAQGKQAPAPAEDA